MVVLPSCVSCLAVNNTSMQIGNRLHCYPTPAQAQTLLAWIGCQRFIYNAKVGEDRNLKPATSIPMSINTGRWHVSFNDGDGDGDGDGDDDDDDDDVPEPSMQETTEYRIPNT